MSILFSPELKKSTRLFKTLDKTGNYDFKNGILSTLFGQLYIVEHTQYIDRTCIRWFIFGASKVNFVNSYEQHISLFNR